MFCLSVDGRETRLDDNPSQELRRQFGELQKRVRALNNYTRFALISRFKIDVSKFKIYSNISKFYISRFRFNISR